jgi:hypothetical protein
MTILIFVLGCRSGALEHSAISFCLSETEALYDPNSEEMLSFPDDLLTTPDPYSPTGLRISITEATAPWSMELPAIIEPAVADLQSRSGFARMGNVVMRFSHPITPGPPTPQGSLTDRGIIWLDISAEPPERIPYQSSLGEDRDQLVLKPLRPLRPGAEHAVFITDEHLDHSGNCITPSEHLKKTIAGDGGPFLSGRSEGHVQAIAAAGIEPGAVSHMLVFTTQDELGQLQQVADSIGLEQYIWSESPSCDGGSPAHCLGAFQAMDHRADGALNEPAHWELPVHIWLPTNAEAPYPVLLYGHGLNQSVSQGTWLAELLADQGVAVVAADAMHHGAHPTADPESNLPALDFLGMNLAEMAFDTKDMRGNIDQTTADRLQVLELLRQNPDVDGDGFPDLDMDTLFYQGESLGGVIGSQMMALAPFDAGVFAVGGGDLPVFLTDTGVMQNFGPIFEHLIGTEDDYARLIPIVQAAIDASEPAVWAAHVMQNRYDGGDSPDLLFPVSVDDDVVPPAAAKALVRGLGIPQLEPAPDPVPAVEEVSGPVQENMPDGSTAAYFQFDRVSSGEGIVQSNHNNVSRSPEGRWMIDHFYRTHLEGGCEIADPYTELETAPLPAD